MAWKFSPSITLGNPPGGQQRVPRSGFRADINGLRALGVALIVAYHVGARGAGGGFIGVDVFFVISGYLMTRIVVDGLRAGTFSYPAFLRARARRIWPPLAALVLALLVLGAFLLPPSDLSQLAEQARAAALFWSNHFFHDHSGYAVTDDGVWLLHTWSLSVEWQFYLLYPLLLAGAARLARAQTVEAASALVLAALFVLSLGWYLRQSNRHPEDAFFLLTGRAWQMAAGGLALLAERRAPPVRARVRAWAGYGGTALILLSALILGRAHVAPVGLGWRSLVPVAGAALVLWSGFTANRLLAPRWVQAIGSASYSIYLWHWPLVVACELDNLPVTHPHPTLEAEVLASLLLGWLSSRFLERGAFAHGRMWRPVALLALTGGAAAFVYATGGLAFRMPSVAAGGHAAETDYFPADCSNFMKRGDELRSCPIARDGRRHVLVIGDSHAEHLFPWFQAKSKVSVDFFTEAECPPVPAFERLQSGFHCLDYADAAWRRAQDPRYDTVILSSSWGIIGDLGPAYCHRDASGSCQRVPDQARRRTLALVELRAAIEATLAAGKTFAVLDDTPASLYDIPRRLEREQYWFGAVHLSIDHAGLIAHDAWIDGLFGELAARPRFHLLSLRPALCDERTCRVYDPAMGASIYVDGGHLAPWWIVRHGDLFAPFVQYDGA